MDDRDAAAGGKANGVSHWYSTSLFHGISHLSKDWFQNSLYVPDLFTIQEESMIISLDYGSSGRFISFRR